MDSSPPDDLTAERIAGSIRADLRLGDLGGLPDAFAEVLELPDLPPDLEEAQRRAWAAWLALEAAAVALAEALERHP